MTEGRCCAWNFSLLYSPLSWQAWWHTSFADGWTGTGNSQSRLKNQDKRSPGSCNCRGFSCCTWICFRYNSLLEHIIAYAICNCNMQEWDLHKFEDSSLGICHPSAEMRASVKSRDLYVCIRISPLRLWWAFGRNDRVTHNIWFYMYGNVSSCRL